MITAPSFRSVASTGWLRSAAALFAGLALWQWFHPYFGIRDDARIYLLGAVQRLTPESFGRDLWFTFGSQDQFSLFSPLLGVLVRTVDIGPAALLAAWLGGLCWVAASLLFCRAAFNGRQWIVPFVALVALPMNYGPSMAIFVTEAVATSRPFAASLALAALAFSLGGRPAAAILAGGLATALHPLVGIWGLAAVVAAGARDRVLLFAGIAVAAALVLAAWNPLDWPILSPISGVWGEAIRATPMVVLRPWPAVRADSVLWGLGALLWAGRLGHHGLRRTYQVVALLGACGFLVALVLGYFLPIRVFLQLQPWRALWLAGAVAVVAAIDVGRALLGLRSQGRVLLGAAIATFLLRESGGGLLLAASFACAVRWPGHAARIIGSSRAQQVLAWLAVGVIIICMPGWLADSSLESGSALEPGADAYRFMLDGLVPALLQVALPAAAAAFLAAASPVVLVPLAVASTIWGALHWDGRALDVRYFESRYRVGGNPEAFGGLIRPGQSVVYWSRQGLRVWYELGTANYASQEQRVGMVFSEGRTMKLSKRFERVALKSSTPDARGVLAPDNALLARLVQVRHLSSPAGFAVTGYEPMSLTESGLRRLCGDDELDFVIDSAAIGGLWSAEHVDQIGMRHDRYYLYDCRRLRTTR